jgi:hypothetical protein
MTKVTHPVTFLNVHEAAARLRCHPRTLARWRSLEVRYGPCPLFIGGRVYYAEDEIARFTETQQQAARRKWRADL